MTTKDLILFLLGLLVFYHLFLKKENFSLPSGIISDPNSLDPNKRYIIYNRRASNLQQNSVNLSPTDQGYTCPEFPDFLYQLAPGVPAVCSTTAPTNPTNIDFTKYGPTPLGPALGSRIKNLSLLPTTPWLAALVGTNSYLAVRLVNGRMQAFSIDGQNPYFRNTLAEAQADVNNTFKIPVSYYDDLYTSPADTTWQANAFNALLKANNLTRTQLSVP
jgi:hypothetical protein